MTKKKKQLVWLAPLGQTVYENVNPFWAFCEAADDPVHRVVVFHAREMKSKRDEAVHLMEIVSEEYFGQMPSVKGVAFDDENVNDFKKHAETLFREIAEDGNRLILDISPTTWSYVPVFLMKMAWEFRPSVQAALYVQYADHRMRHRPYPLIPRKGVIHHDLLQAFSEKKGGKR